MTDYEKGFKAGVEACIQKILGERYIPIWIKECTRPAFEKLKPPKRKDR